MYIFLFSDTNYVLDGFRAEYSISACPSNCTGRGYCLKGRCVCNEAEWGGPDCSRRLCPNSKYICLVILYIVRLNNSNLLAKGENNLVKQGIKHDIIIFRMAFTFTNLIAKYLLRLYVLLQNILYNIQFKVLL